MKNKLLLLYIYNIFSGTIFGQNLYLSVQGNDSTQTSVIEQLFYTKKFDNYYKITEELDTITQKLLQAGYIETEFLGTEKTSDSTYAAFFNLHHLYQKVRITNPEVFSNAGLSEKELEVYFLDIKTGDFIIPFISVEKILQELQQKIAEKGMPFSSLQLSHITAIPEVGIIDARVSINTSSVRTLGGIVIRGYEKFPKPYLTYSAGLKKGMLFEYQKIVTRSNLLDKLPFTRIVKPPEALFKEDKTVLYLYLEKVKANSFDGILGFSSNEDTGTLDLNGYVQLNLINNLNYGESFSLEYQNDGQLQERFDVSIDLPYLFNSPVGVEAGLSFFKQDSTYITTNQHLYLNYKINYKTKLFGGYKQYQSDNLLEDENLSLLIQDYSIKAGVLGGTYEQLQNNRLFPVKTGIKITTEIGNKNVTKGKSPFYSVYANFLQIFNLNPINSIYTELQSAYLSSESPSENEQLKLGGIKSIRGFEESSLTASLFSVIRTEYRYMIASNSYVHTITDAAYLKSHVTEETIPLYSFGIGLGHQTKAGVLQLNIANGKANSQNFKWANTKIHISLRAVF